MYACTVIDYDYAHTDTRTCTHSNLCYSFFLTLASTHSLKLQRPRSVNSNTIQHV